MDREIVGKHTEITSRGTDIEKKVFLGKKSSTIAETCSENVNVRTQNSRSADNTCKYGTKSSQTNKTITSRMKLTRNHKRNKNTVTKGRMKNILNQNAKKKQTKALLRVPQSSTKIKCKTKNHSFVENIKGNTKPRLKEIEKRKRMSKKQWASEINHKREKRKSGKALQKRQVNNGNVKQSKKNSKVVETKQKKEMKAESFETTAKVNDNKNNSISTDISGKRGGFSSVDQKVTQLDKTTDKNKNKLEEVDSEPKSLRTKSRTNIARNLCSCSDSELHSVSSDLVSAPQRGRKRKVVEESDSGLKRKVRVKGRGSVRGDRNRNIILKQEETRNTQVCESFAPDTAPVASVPEISPGVTRCDDSDSSGDELPEAFTPKKESTQGGDTFQ